MMSLHFGLSSELSGAIAKKLPHAKNQLPVPGSFFNQFVIYIYKRASLACAAHILSCGKKSASQCSKQKKELRVKITNEKNKRRV